MNNKIYDIGEIAKLVRAELKKEFPTYKFSVTIERFAGGAALNVSVMSGTEELIVRNGRDGNYVQVNQYHIDSYTNPDNEYTVLTKNAVKMLKKVNVIANRYNWDNSDSSRDYFDVNYYFHLQIGKWDKPYQVK